MKILNRTEFMQLPPGVLYCKGKPWYFNGLSVKADSLFHPAPRIGDFVQLDLLNIESGGSSETLFYRYQEMLDHGVSYPNDNVGFGRDGCFDKDDIFLVWEKDDLVRLRAWIDEAILLG